MILSGRPAGSSLVVTAMVRKVYLARVLSVLSLKFPDDPPGRDQGKEKGELRAHNFRPSGFDDRGTSPSSVLIQRLKASFNIYDLFRFNSTRKLEAYLYSSGWLAGWLALRRARRQSDLNPLRPDLGSKFRVSFHDSRRKCAPSSLLNIIFYSILKALQVFAKLCNEFCHLLFMCILCI